MFIIDIYIYVCIICIIISVHISIGKCLFEDDFSSWVQGIVIERQWVALTCDRYNGALVMQYNFINAHNSICNISENGKGITSSFWNKQDLFGENESERERDWERFVVSV